VGTRIHKVIGWGLTDIKCDEKDIPIDHRLNVEAFKPSIFYKKEGDFEGFINWVQNNKEECKNIVDKVDGREEGRSSSSLDMTFIFGKIEDGKIDKSKFIRPVVRGEYGMSNVMMFRHLTHQDWGRYDDIMDYYECDESQDSVKDLTHRCGIWPYQGIIHIPGSPKYGKEGYPDYMNGGEYNMAIGIWTEKTPPLLSGDKLDYYKTYYRPVIAGSIVLHIYWLDIFKDFYKTIQELRPMIYTYWG